MLEYGIFNDRSSNFWNDNPRIHEKAFDWLFDSPIYVTRSEVELRARISQIQVWAYPKVRELIIKQREIGEWYV